MSAKFPRGGTGPFLARSLNHSTNGFIFCTFGLSMRHSDNYKNEKTLSKRLIFTTPTNYKRLLFIFKGKFTPSLMHLL